MLRRLAAEGLEAQGFFLFLFGTTQQKIQLPELHSLRQLSGGTSRVSASSRFWLGRRRLSTSYQSVVHSFSLSVPLVLSSVEKVFEFRSLSLDRLSPRKKASILTTHTVIH